MILLLILYYLSAYSQGIAAPVASSIDPNESPYTDIPDLCPRKRVEIIWSCLATILAASWVSVHPNMPGRQDSKLKKILRRVELMLWAIIMPELIICWAMRQWHGTRRMKGEFLDLQRKLETIKQETYPHHNHQMENIDSISSLLPMNSTNARIAEDKFRWTKTHGFFLQMGGFVLHENGRQKRILWWEKLLELYKARKIDLSDITEARISDHSKADGFAKGLALVQTTWFIVQCLARFLDGNLVLTELELATGALAVLSLVMYILWWNKPFNAEIPIIIAVSESSAKDYQDEGEEGRVHLLDLKNVLSMLQRIPQRIVDIMQSEEDPTTEVPTFYSVASESYLAWHQMALASFSIAALFGVIHCAGWSTKILFSSHMASILWKSSSLIITTSPLLWILTFAFEYAYSSSKFNTLSKRLYSIAFQAFACLTLLTIPLYIISRVILLILAFVELRHAPPGALANIPWANSIPFIH